MDMKNVGRLLGLLTVKFLGEAEDKIAEYLGLSTGQHFDVFLFAPWGMAPDPWIQGNKEWMKVYYVDPEMGGWRFTPWKVLEWGPWTVVVESAQDGAGRTRVFSTARKLDPENLTWIMRKWGDVPEDVETD